MCMYKHVKAIWSFSTVWFSCTCRRTYWSMHASQVTGKSKLCFSAGQTFLNQWTRQVHALTYMYELLSHGCNNELFQSSDYILFLEAHVQPCLMLVWNVSLCRRVGWKRLAADIGTRDRVHKAQWYWPGKTHPRERLVVRSKITYMPFVCVCIVHNSLYQWMCACNVHICMRTHYYAKSMPCTRWVYIRMWRVCVCYILVPVHVHLHTHTYIPRDRDRDCDRDTYTYTHKYYTHNTSLFVAASW
jgi:hypothetical protein